MTAVHIIFSHTYA